MMTFVNFFILPAWGIIAFAVCLDLLIGDPPWLYHPVRAIGSLSTTLERLFRALMASTRLTGTLFALFVISLVTGVALALTWVSFLIHPILGTLVQIIGIAMALAIHSLANEGWVIKNLLVNNQIEEARERISLIVSRDMSEATPHDIIRALLETMTENLSDGIIAPLCFAMIGGLPGVWFYKTINTLDSMVGYKNEQYLEFGWFSAKLDDVVNLIPARITGVLMLLTSLLLHKNTKQALKGWKNDAQKGPSPNGGIPIVTFAGAQDIMLGGDCKDRKGTVISIPYVGGSRRSLTISDISSVLLFHYLSSFLFVGIFLGLKLL